MHRKRGFSIDSHYRAGHVSADIQTCSGVSREERLEGGEGSAIFSLKNGIVFGIGSCAEELKLLTISLFMKRAEDRPTSYKAFVVR